MRHAKDGQLVARTIVVSAAVSTARWVIAFHDVRGFRKPTPYVDGRVIARGVAYIVGDCTRPRGDQAVGYVTRDPRKKERRKYGQRAARARFQFSKR